MTIECGPCVENSFSRNITKMIDTHHHEALSSVKTRGDQADRETTRTRMQLEAITTDKSLARPFASVHIAEKFAKQMAKGSECQEITVNTKGKIFPVLMFNGIPHYFA